MQKLKQFESIFTKLITRLVQTFEINPDDTFEQFNYVDSQDELFDDFFDDKKDLGKVLRELTKLIGVPTVASILQTKLDELVKQAMGDKENTSVWIKIHSILTCMEQVTRII